jgi:signal peptidase complex subunit 2
MSDSSANDAASEEVEGVLAEPDDRQVIDTGDSVKVKQVMDEITVETVKEMGFEPNWYWDNMKLFLMAVSCVFALVAQFYPTPFPDSRPLLGVCCAGYFILSTVLQYIITFIDKDTVFISQPNDVYNRGVRVRTDFPRFSDTFTLSIEDDGGVDFQASVKTTAKMYVGKYFTEEGDFDQVGLAMDTMKVIRYFLAKKYKTFEINHKSD